MEITRQADSFGLPPADPPPAPPAEKVADQLRQPPMWSGPATVDTE